MTENVTAPAMADEAVPNNAATDKPAAKKAAARTAKKSSAKKATAKKSDKKDESYIVGHDGKRMTVSEYRDTDEFKGVTGTE